MIKIAIIIIIFWVGLWGYVFAKDTATATTGWKQSSPSRYEYMVNGKRLAVVRVGDNAGWVWSVFIGVDLSPNYYYGVACCKDDAIAAVEKVLDDRYRT